MRGPLSLVLLLALGAGALPTLGCGGSGATPTTTPPPISTTPPAALFSGTYFHHTYRGNFTIPTVQTTWGQILADGLGQVTGGALTINDGLGGLSNALVLGWPYLVDAANRMTWPITPSLNAQGGIAADGSAAALSSIGTAGWPSVAILVRKGGAFGPGSLTGPYHLVGMYHAPGNDYSEWGKVTFTGPGTATEVITENQNGVVLGPWNTVQSHTVAADGTATYDFTPGIVPTRGGILDGGDLVVLAGGTTAAFPGVLVVLLRQSASASLATFSGRYHMVGFSFVFPSGPPPHFNSFTGTVHADGAGALTTHVGGDVNSDGVVVPFPPAPGNDTYAVAPDGTLTVTTPTTTLVGGVSPDGRFAAFAGGTTAASLPQFWFLVR